MIPVVNQLFVFNYKNIPNLLAVKSANISQRNPAGPHEWNLNNVQNLSANLSNQIARPKRGCAARRAVNHLVSVQNHLPFFQL